MQGAQGLLPSSTSVLAVRALSDEHLLGAQRTLAEARRALDASAAVIAGEVCFRSRRELGYRGLAQRHGFRTPERLVQHTPGSTARDASAFVTVGSIVHDAQTDAEAGAEVAITDSSTQGGATGPAELLEPWLLPVGRAVASGAAVFLRPQVFLSQPAMVSGSRSRRPPPG